MKRWGLGVRASVTSQSPHETLGIRRQSIGNVPIKRLVEEHFNCYQVDKGVLTELHEQDNPGVLRYVQSEREGSV